MVKSRNFDERPWAFVGALLGPALGILFSFSRIGPPGLIWWQGKGGETIQTPLGRGILSVTVVVGAFASAFLALVLEARYRHEARAVKPKGDAPQVKWPMGPRA